jgi:hypothetical protein
MVPMSVLRRVAGVLLATLPLGGCDRGGSGAAREADTLMRAESAATASVARSRPAPPELRFEDYAVEDTSTGGRTAGVDFASAPYGRMFRTKLREGAAPGPNFAGHYTVVLWGCGTGCQIVSVIDARTGRLSRQTLLTANGVRYRRDSRLLFADPPDPEQPADCASCGTPAYYVWEGGEIRPVGAGLHPHLGGQRPWATECVASDSGAEARAGLYTCPK